MFAVIRRKLAMIARVRDFAQANPSTDAGYGLVVGQLKEGLAKAEALAIQQRDGRGEEPLAVARRRASRDVLQRRFLPHLVQVAVRARKERPTLGEFSRPRGNLPLNTFITATKAMEAQAIPERELLTRLGVGDTFFEDFHQAIADFDSATEAVHAARRDHVGARSELVTATEECVQLVGVLNGLVLGLFKDQVQALAAWESASTVVRFHSTSQEDVPAPTETPVIPVVPSAPASPTTTDGAIAA